MEQEIKEINKKLDAIFESTEKTRKYFLLIIWVSIIAFILPLLGLLFFIPRMISSYGSMMNF